jgi:hypothetical protein
MKKVKDEWEIVGKILFHPALSAFIKVANEVLMEGL